MMAGDYEKLVKLGSGSYGAAWLVSNKRFGNKLVLKEINLRNLNDKDIKQALTEVDILAKCKHQHIISYCEAFVTREVETLSIVMEHAEMGDLHQKITERRGLYFPDEVILKLFSHLVSALDYIHIKGILHRDVKPQNLFLTSKQTLKLGDFGISRVFTSHSDKACTFIGTPFYLSPEVCRQEPYSYASDMWAAGCVLYEMCCLCVPFTASNMAALAVKIELAQYKPLPNQYGRVLHKLVQSLLTPDPQKRPSAQDIHKMDLTLAKPSIDSNTYTVIKHPTKLRSSLASPELSAMLHKQRTQTLEGQRAFASADNPRNPRRAWNREEKAKRSASPCFNLYGSEFIKKKQQRCDQEAVEDNSASKDINDVSLDGVIKDLYKSYTSPSSLTANGIRNSLVKLVGQQTFDDLLVAVKRKAKFEDTKKISPFSDQVLPLFLLYIKMTDG